MKARLTAHRAFQIGKISPLLYGSFIEHMGRAIYNGIYEPTHPTADAKGFREDVKQLVREMRVPILRYPGGNFLSGYHWEDGVGPREARPKKLDPAWRQLEPNQVGTDEFHAWAREVGSEVMMAVNLGTRGPEDAAHLLEYCNMPGGSHYADMRVKNGVEAPYGDRVWCLGNEMDGPWQIGCRTAEDYGDIARKTAGLMRMIDPNIRLVACGSSGYAIPTFGAWEQAVLERAYDQIDCISLHQYFVNDQRDRAAYLANSVHMDRFIENVTAICDAAAARLRKRRRINLSFDEWNVQNRAHACDNDKSPWAIGPAREEYIFTMEDALLFGSMLMSLIRHCDRVEMACLAQLINVCAPIMTVTGGPVWKQTTYHPFQLTSEYGRGTALETRVSCPDYAVNEIGPVPYVDAVTVWNEEKSEAVLFAVNRSISEAVDLEAAVEGLGKTEIIEHAVLFSGDPDAVNGPDAPDRVAPRKEEKTRIENGVVQAQLPPYSWNMIRVHACE